MRVSKLVIEKAIEIHAPAARVWDLLTKPGYNCLWASEFSNGTQLGIESTWTPGSPVHWKNSDGRIVNEGIVTAVQLDKLLRFTVRDVRQDGQLASAETDSTLTYKLSEESGTTTLRILQVGFSLTAAGRKYERKYEYAWDRVLPHLKRLAEQP